MIDTFSVHSLKILEKSKEEFEKRFIDKIEFYKKDENAKLGNIFHGLISYRLQNYNVEKFEQFLNDEEKKAYFSTINSDLMKFILNSDKKFIEQPFFIKSELNKKPFYLTGRFDLVVQNGENFTIIDWKTKTIPKTPKEDLQTVVYTYALSEMMNTKKIEMVYYSVFKQLESRAFYDEKCFEKITGVIEKVLH